MAKVLFIANAPSPNTTDLYRALNAAVECEVSVVYTMGRHNQKWTSPVAVVGYESVFLPTGLALYRRAKTLIGLIRARDVRLLVVQGYTPLTHLLGMLVLSGFRHRPWVYWGERMRVWPDETLLRKLAKHLVIRLIRRADRVLAIGIAGAESYAKLGIDRAALSSIPYARNLAPFLAVQESGSRSGLAIVCTARLISSKGVDRLLDAFAQLAASRPNLVLHLVGDGPERATLEAAVPAALRQQVVFHGYLGAEGQARVYAGAHVFALVSQHDGWGMVVLEAMAAGLPVVATDTVVSAAELLEGGQAGTLVRPGDADALVHALRRLLDNFALRTSQGAAARRIARRYDSQNTARALGEILSKVALENG